MSLDAAARRVGTAAYAGDFAAVYRELAAAAAAHMPRDDLLRLANTTTSEQGWTALHQAAFYDQPGELIRELGRLGVDALAVTSDGKTAADIAKERKRSCYAVLLEMVTEAAAARGVPVPSAPPVPPAPSARASVGAGAALATPLATPSAFVATPAAGGAASGGAHAGMPSPQKGAVPALPLSNPSAVAHGPASIMHAAAAASGSGSGVAPRVSEKSVTVPVSDAPTSAAARAFRVSAGVLLSAAGDSLGHRWRSEPSGYKIQRELVGHGGAEGINVNAERCPVSANTILAMATADAAVRFLNRDAQPRAINAYAPDGEWLVCPNDVQAIRDFTDGMADTYVRAFQHMDHRHPAGRTARAVTTMASGGVTTMLPYVARVDVVDNGAAARAAWLGAPLCGSKRRPLLVAAAVESARLTHNHVSSISSAVTAAAFTAFAIEGVPPTQWGVRLVRQILPLTRKYLVACGRDSGIDGPLGERADPLSTCERMWVQYLEQRALWGGGAGSTGPGTGSIEAGASDGGYGAAAIRQAATFAVDAESAPGDHGNMDGHSVPRLQTPGRGAGSPGRDGHRSSAPMSGSAMVAKASAVAFRNSAAPESPAARPRAPSGISHSVLFPAAYGVTAREGVYKSCFNIASVAGLSPNLSSSGFFAWDAYSAPLIAYDALLASGGTWDGLLEGAVAHGGDCACTGSLACGWFGAMHGTGPVPPSNFTEVEFGAVLADTARQLAELAELAPASSPRASDAARAPRSPRLTAMASDGGPPTSGPASPKGGRGRTESGGGVGVGGAAAASSSSSSSSSSATGAGTGAGAGAGIGAATPPMHPEEIESAWPAPHTPLMPADFPNDSALLVVGDVHGHVDLFDRAIDAARAMVGPRRHLVVVTLGNYVDNGPNVPELLDRLISLRTCPPPDLTLLPIAGNHDLVCVLSADPGAFGAASSVWFKRWMASYPRRGLDGHDASFCTPLQYPRTGESVRRGEPSAAAFRAAFDPHHLRFLASLPWYQQLGNFVFVHAGLTVGPVGPQLAELAKRDLSRMMPGHLPAPLRDTALSVVADPDWSSIVVSGLAKFDAGTDYVTSRRLTLHNGAGDGEALHCAILPMGATSLRAASAGPTLFRVEP